MFSLLAATYLWIAIALTIRSFDLRWGFCRKLGTILIRFDGQISFCDRHLCKTVASAFCR